MLLSAVFYNAWRLGCEKQFHSDCTLAVLAILHILVQFVNFMQNNGKLAVLLAFFHTFYPAIDIANGQEEHRRHAQIDEKVADITV